MDSADVRDGGRRALGGRIAEAFGRILRNRTELPKVHMFERCLQSTWRAQVPAEPVGHGAR
jgi:hypothetical protein